MYNEAYATTQTRCAHKGRHFYASVKRKRHSAG